MVNAGRVAPLPRGAWNGTTTYAMLDIVTYNDVAWIAKRESLGQTPADNAYWQRFGSSAPIATTSTAGIVIPDGTTIAVAADGTISVVAKLGDLANVELTDLATGQVIAYNATTQKWVNVDISTTLAGLEDVDLTGVQDGQIIAYNATTQKWEPIDPPSSQKSEILIDYDPAEMTGITVTLAHVASAEGHTPESYTITLDNTGEVEQDVINLGLWTITWTHKGQSYSEEFDVHYYGYFHIMLHEGFTWRQWMVAGGLPINKYDSLAELLANQKDIRRLCTIHDAVDYMCGFVNVNNDLETIINNDIFAKWVSLSDYSMDNMEANAAIKDTMDESDKYGYGEWALMPQVPKMTSDTAPYGVCSAKDYYSSAYPAYYAFDDNVSTYYNEGEGSDNKWIKYTFANEVVISKVKFRPENMSAFKSRCGGYVYIKDENDNVLKAVETSSLPDTAEVDILLDNPTRVNVIKFEHTKSSPNGVGITSLQFYAWAPKGNVPIMTSNTAPYGEASASSASSGYEAYRVFDGASGQWLTSGANMYIQYKFTNPVCIKRAYVKSTTSASRTITYKVSNDGSTWTDLSESITVGANAEHTEEFSQDNYWLYVRMAVAESATTAFSNLQFYGRELKVSVPTMTSNTAPYGEVIASHATTGTYPSWQVFDNNDATAWSSGVTANCWVGYESVKPMRAEFVKIKVYKGGSGNSELKNFKIQGSNDGTNWDDLYTGLVPVGGTDLAFTLDNPTNYKHHRLYAIDTYHTSVGILTLQFYGKDYSEKEFANDGSKWLYDHGVELEEFIYNTVGSGSISEKTNDEIYIEIPASSQRATSALVSADLTNHSILRAVAGKQWVATTEMIVGSNARPSYSGSISEAYVDIAPPVSKNNLVLSVISFDTTKYVGFYSGNNTGSTHCLSTFTELWLE